MAECFSRPDEGRSAAWRACRCIGVGSCDERSVLPKETICTARTPRDHLLCPAGRARRHRDAADRAAGRRTTAPGHRRRLPRRLGPRPGDLVLRWFREDADMKVLAADTGISLATGYRYLHEGIDVL